MTFRKITPGFVIVVLFLLSVAVPSTRRLYFSAAEALKRSIVPAGEPFVPSAPSGLMAEVDNGNFINGEWTWVDRNQIRRTKAELDGILREHQLWFANKAGGNRADFSGADLSRADLQDAFLSFAILTKANLNMANLKRAHLDHTELSQSQLMYAQLQGASLDSATLDRANLTSANLTGGRLNAASLRNAYLQFANLAHADVVNADFTGADFRGADVSGAVFEPKVSPEPGTMATVNGLKLLTYRDDSSVLAQLRKQFKDGGFRSPERQITYALKRKEELISWYGCESRKFESGSPRPILFSEDSVVANCGAFFLNRFCFDFTCEYGLSPGRPLSLGVVLFLLCSVLYLICIHGSGKKAALYRVYVEDIRGDQVPSRRPERIRPWPLKRSVWWIGSLLWREVRLFGTAMFFGLMSAFNIGFRDINFGRWLRLLTREEFDIKALGWARVIAGWQSLLSVYLLALWVLTYFGRPFE